MLCTCIYVNIHIPLLFFWEDTEWAIDDSVYKKSGYVGDIKNRFVSHFVSFCTKKKFFFPCVYKTFVKRGLSGDIWGFFSFMFFYTKTLSDVI